jgi:hypothetical protein
MSFLIKFYPCFYQLSVDRARHACYDLLPSFCFDKHIRFQSEPGRFRSLATADHILGSDQNPECTEQSRLV